MSQHTYARALALLEDNGIDHDTARYIMKRLHDYGYTARERDTSPGADPPAASTSVPTARVSRATALATARQQIADAKAKAEAELQASIEAAQREEQALKARVHRQIQVQKVLARLP